MQTVAIMNVKGGVGKTVTTVNLATILAEFYGKRVLVIDADPQGDTTAFFGVQNEDSSLALMFTGLVDCYADLVEHTDFDRVDIIPSSTDLFEIDRKATRDIVKRTISDLRDSAAEDGDYDLILIDCPPSFTASSVSALAAVDHVIIPVKLDAFSVRGMEFLMAQVRELHKINGRCVVDGVLITHWHNTPLVHQAEAMLRERGIPVFQTHIRRSDKVDESTWCCEPLSIYSKFSAAGVDYRTFVAEWVGGISDGI